MTDDNVYTMTFTDREGYLAWRAMWRAELVSIVTEIRTCKIERRDPGSTDRARNGANIRRQRLRWDASNLMDIRHASKKKSAQQFEAARALARARPDERPLEVVSEHVELERPIALAS